MSRFLNSTVGEYRLVDFIGAGGMGEVYRAVHDKLGRMVALKVLTSASAEMASAQRFLNEARIQSSLRHPGVATLYDFMDWQGRPVIVMEYVDGQTLSDRIAASGAIPASETASIGSSIADTLAYVHSRGIVHRDLKCSNIKISSTRQVKLLDFGIARAPEDARLTRTGFMVGTFQNLSPEQVMGQEATASSDIWALGTVLYEMATGRPPFVAPTPPELFTKIAKADFTLPSVLNPAMPKALEYAICRCLRRKPAERYQSAMELREELSRICAVQAPEPARKPPKQFQFTPRGWIFAGIGVGILAILLGFFLFRADPGPSLKSLDLGVAKVERTADEGTTETGKVTLNVQGDLSAEVYENGRAIGATPFTTTKRFGEKIDVVLRRPGFQDVPVQFAVSKREYNYTYTLEPARP